MGEMAASNKNLQRQVVELVLEDQDFTPSLAADRAGDWITNGRLDGPRLILFDEVVHVPLYSFTRACFCSHICRVRRH